VCARRNDAVKHFLGLALFPPAYLLAVAVVAFSPRFIVDDAYISFRYAAQLVAGNGLVFNPGERVEGYSNLLWTLIHAFPIRIGIRIEIFTFLFGLSCGLLTLFVFQRLCLKLDYGLPLMAVLSILFGLHADFWLSVTMGLEGGLFALLLTVILLLVLPPFRVGRLLAASSVGGMLWLVRPEGVGVALLVLLTVFGHLAHQRKELRFAAPLLVPASIILLGSVAWRLTYYGQWMPNSLIAKSPPIDPLYAIAGIKLGFEYLAGALGGGVRLIFILGVLGTVTGHAPSWYRSLCAMVVAWGLVVAVGNGGDWMPHHRLVTPYTPMVLLLAGQGMQSLRSWVRFPSFAYKGMLCVLFLASVVSLPRHSWLAVPRLSVKSDLGCYDQIGKLLNIGANKDDVVAPEAIGVLGYRSLRLTIHDFLGLIDAHVAATGADFRWTFGRANYGYTYSLRPAIFVFHSGEYHQKFMMPFGYPLGYEVFQFQSDPCNWASLTIALRKDRVRDLLNALAPLNLAPRRLSWDKT